MALVHQQAPQPGSDTLLGIEKSAAGRCWMIRTANDRLAVTLAQRLGLPDPIARLLAARGIGVDEASNFLAPTLRASMPGPDDFADMTIAAERIARAITTGESIIVFGDYDVDGATSVAVMQRGIRAAGGEIGVYIPDRLTEGYGPNSQAMQHLASEGARVIVTVDCGTTAFEALETAARAGLDVIVVDHHEAEAKLPRAVAVVNPKRLDRGTPEQSHLAAVGLTFILVATVCRVLQKQGWFTDRTMPDLLALLDIVALGTVCDMVPLTGVNRAFVTQGLKVMAQRGNPGLSALADTAGIDERPVAYHLGFVFGPRINAGGRVGESRVGARLLACDDREEATMLANRLDSLNRERQLIEQDILSQAQGLAEQQVASRNPAVLVIADTGWHPGIIGIVASRLKDTFNRPTCVIALENGEGTGSGRSVAGVDLGQAVIAARQSGLLTRGGGHMMAAGFSLRIAKLESFRHFLETRVAQQMAATGFHPTQTIDGCIKTAAATVDLIGQIAGVGPFGTANPEPRFAFANVRLSFADIVGEHHIRCRIEDDSGGWLDGIAFRAVGSVLGDLLLDQRRLPLHVTGKLRLNTWQGRTKPQLVIDDAATAHSPLCLH